MRMVDQLANSLTIQYWTQDNMKSSFKMVDEEGQIFQMLQDIVDHHTSEGAVPKSEGYWANSAGRRCQRRTSKVWDILVQ
eukprot:14072883-Ditylum_brightwellii.AAC.1